MAKKKANNQKKTSKKQQRKAGAKQQPLPLPPELEALLKTAFDLHQKKESARAEVLYRKILRQRPDCSEARKLLGILIYERGNLNGAIVQFQKAAALAPEDADIQLVLGEALRLAKRFDAAIACYERALKIDPENVKAYNDLGVVTAQTGDFAAAKGYFQKAIALQPDFAEPHYNLGKASEKQDLLEEAIAYYEKAIALQPDYAEAKQNLQRARKLQRKQIALMECLEETTRQIADVEDDEELLESLLQLSVLHFLEVEELLERKEWERAREKARAYVEWETNAGEVLPEMLCVGAYLKSGDRDGLDERWQAIGDRVLQDGDRLHPIEIALLYERFCFCLPYLQDNLAENTTLLAAIGRLYKECPTAVPALSIETTEDLPDPPGAGVEGEKATERPLRIGILSRNFKRSAVGWATVDFIEQLSLSTPHLYLYATDATSQDDLAERFQQVAEKFYQQKRKPDGSDDKVLLARLAQDNLDAIVSLDSLTDPIQSSMQAALLQAYASRGRPAPVCLTWSGFDAPFMSEEGFFLGDRHTHPAGVEDRYVEKLARMPHSHLVSGGFTASEENRETLRQQHQIEPERVVFLSVAPGIKFHRELAATQAGNFAAGARIVCCSTKGRGDRELIHQIYR